MGIQNKDINLIEDFLDGTLSENEKTKFMESLKHDLKLRSLFNYRNKIGQLIVSANELEQNRAFVSQSIKRYKNKRTDKYAIAATILLLIGISSVTFLHEHVKSKKHLNQYTADKTGSSLNQSIQTDHYRANEKTQLSIATPVYSVNDTIELFFDLSANEQGFKQLIVKEAISQDTSITISIPTQQKYIRLLPGQLNKGTYEWYINQSKMKGKFTIQ